MMLDIMYMTKQKADNLDSARQADIQITKEVVATAAADCIREFFRDPDVCGIALSECEVRYLASGIAMRVIESQRL